MYSPKIREEHIPGLYRLARSRGIPMTVLVDEVLSALLAQPDIQAAVTAVAIPSKSSPGAQRPGLHTRSRRAKEQASAC